MKTRLAILLALLLGTFQLAACAAPTTDAVSPETTPQEGMAAVEQNMEPNFLLLVSDEPNDIRDFDELWVTVSSVGFVPCDSEGNDGDSLVVPLPGGPTSFNLAALTGDDAVALWEGFVPEGGYNQVFLYVDEIWGILVGAEEEDTIEVKLPSNKLHVQAPVTVGDEPDGETTDFVFDITVHRAGNSGQYIVTPQISESGEGQQYHKLEQTQTRLMTGRPEWAGKPDDAGKPEKAGKPEEAGTGAQGGPHEDTGKPDDGGKRAETGTPSSAVIPGENKGSGGNNQQS